MSDGLTLHCLSPVACSTSSGTSSPLRLHLPLLLFFCRAPSLHARPPIWRFSRPTASPPYIHISRVAPTRPRRPAIHPVYIPQFHVHVPAHSDTVAPARVFTFPISRLSPLIGTRLPHHCSISSLSLSPPLSICSHVLHAYAYALRRTHTWLCLRRHELHAYTLSTLILSL